MKLSQTRIKIVTLSDGTEQFIAQHKPWLFWYNFSDFDGYSALKNANPYTVCYRDIHRTIEGAQNEINDYLEYFNEIQQREEVQNSKKVRYVKIPITQRG